MKILTIYDGTIQSKTSLGYGLRKVTEKGGELIVLQVFESHLFVDYEAGPKAQEIARAEIAAHRREAEEMISKTGLPVRILSEDGDPVEEAVRVAGAENVGLILSPPRYKAIVKKTPCPVYIIPGTILLPVENNSESIKGDIDAIYTEAKASGSKLLLLGIVPVHLYNPGEKEELEEIKRKIAATSTKMKKILSEKGIETAEITRSGYPDEEILKAAEEYNVSLIMLPSGRKTPSELAKAAAILLDEQESLKRPIYLLGPAHA